MDHERLKSWFLLEKRELPWRENPSSYAVWVSEVMLQQTQVATVIPYFERWMQKYPDVLALSLASIDDVIKSWEGLGYYSRARNLHAAAKDIVKNHGGNFPKSEEELQKIKGLGPYTVAAIRSFAFHEKAAPVDGNVIRVLTRYFNISDDIGSSKTLKMLRIKAQEILPQDHHWIHSEALIELGAKICTKKPKCEKCPLFRSCRAYKGGNWHLLPIKRKKTEYVKLYRDVAVITYKKQLLIKRCKKPGLMQDLYEFPYFERSSFDINEKDSVEEMGRMLGTSLKLVKSLCKVSHTFTHHRVTLRPFHVEAMVSLQEFDRIALEDIEKLAFSSGHKRVLQGFLYG